MTGGLLPGLRHVDHAAYTVPDLDEAVRFFVEVAAEAGDTVQRIQEEVRALDVALAEKVEQSAAVEIESQVNLFRSLFDQLKRTNQRNRRLIESSARYSRGLADYIANATGSYQGTGLLRPLDAVQATISRRG